MNNLKRKQVTRELEEFLKHAESIEEFFNIHEDKLFVEKPGHYLNLLIGQLGIKRSALRKKVNLSKSFFYEVLSDKKLPSRNNFIQFLIALNQPFKKCQVALKVCGFSPLYARNRWDAVVIYCIENNKNLTEVNILLESQNMTILY